MLGTWPQVQIWALISLKASEARAHSRFLPLLAYAIAADKSKTSANSLITQLNGYLVELFNYSRAAVGMAVPAPPHTHTWTPQGCEAFKL